MTEGRKWPRAVWIVRHGESRGNLARQKAELEGLPDIGIQTRDVDVELSDLGRRQASALGRWFGSMPQDERPTVILTSPYRRTRMTAEGILGGAGIDQDDITYVLDERLREREFGILEGLTKKGVRELYEHQAHFRDLLGKFYHRPPGGESWCDVILRLRSVMGTLSREYRGERVLIVCHAVVVYCLRYLLETMTEEDILEIDRRNEVANCSVTSYVFDPSAGKGGKLVLVQYNDVSPLKAADTEVTNEPPKTSAFRPSVQGPSPLRSYLNGRVTVIVGDITDQHVGAVVNSANSMLRDGSGVTGAIFAAAGEGLREECERLRRASYPQGLSTGEAVVTGGCNLPAPHVIIRSARSKARTASVTTSCWRPATETLWPWPSSGA